MDGVDAWDGGEEAKDILVAEVVFDGLAKALLLFEEGEEAADKAL